MFCWDDDKGQQDASSCDWKRHPCKMSKIPFPKSAVLVRVLQKNENYSTSGSVTRYAFDLLCLQHDYFAAVVCDSALICFQSCVLIDLLYTPAAL